MAIFRVTRDDQGEWRWAFVTENGRTIAVSSEGYASKSGCMASIRLVQDRGPLSPIADRSAGGLHRSPRFDLFP